MRERGRLGRRKASSSLAREERAPEFPPCLYSAIWYAPKVPAVCLQIQPRRLQLLRILFLSCVQIPRDWASITTAHHVTLGCIRSTFDRASAPGNLVERREQRLAVTLCTTVYKVRLRPVPDPNLHKILSQPLRTASVLISALPMQLPTEVLEAIVDQASDNTVSLRNLSLTCTTLLPRSRYHLFSGIVIRTVQQLELSPEFLDSCPWLAPLVRKVTLFVTIPRDNSKPNVRLLDVVPIPLLTRLPNLRAWMMGAGDNESANVSPSLSLHHYALRCYRKHGGRIRSLELSIIVFHSISDFRGLVSAFTGLDSLTCYGIGFQSREREHADSSPVMAGTSVVRPLPISTLKVSLSDFC